MNKKEIRELILDRDIQELEKIMELDTGNKLGNWFYDNIPTDPQYDDVFYTFEYYYDPSNASFMERRNPNGIVRFYARYVRRKENV